MKGEFLKSKEAVLKTSLVVVSVLLLVAVIIYASFVIANASVSTDKADYSPGETVLISGSGFQADIQITQISITRPDGVDVCPNDKCSASLPVTDSQGSFSNYAYVLNGVDGLYTVDVSDGTNNAQTTFTDNGLQYRIYTGCSNDGECQNACYDYDGDGYEDDYLWGGGACADEEGPPEQGNGWCAYNHVEYNSELCNGGGGEDGSVFIEAKWELPDEMPEFEDCEGISPECEIYEEKTTCEQNGCVWVTTQIINPQPVIKCAAVCNSNGWNPGIMADAFVLFPPHEESQICIAEVIDMCKSECDGNQNCEVECIDVYIGEYCPVYDFEFLNPDPFQESICWQTIDEYDPEFWEKEGLCMIYTGIIAPPPIPGKYTVFVKAWDDVSYDFMENKFLYLEEVVECEVDEDCSYLDDNCHIGVCNQENECEQQLNDNTGPVTSGLTAKKDDSLCQVTIEALETDDCSNIAAAEYFLGGSTCGTAGTGTSMNAKDGNWDELIEDVIKNNVGASDGSLNVNVRGKDSQGNWGACKTIKINVDCIAPGYPTCTEGGVRGILVNGECNADELLVCGDNPLIKANICDSQSRIQLAEYFIDEDCNNPEECLNWYGINMTANDGLYDELCEDVEDYVDLSQLEEGTHYIELHGKDGQENWGKWDFSPRVSFIKDTTAPESYKEVGDLKIECDYYGDEDEADSCYYIRHDTPIYISCEDPDPQQTGEFAGGEKLYYRQRIKQDFEDDWAEWGSWTQDLDGEATIYKTEDSIHELEYYCVDACDNEEEHHFEIDIVDSKAPVTEKIVGEPKVPCEQGEECDYYITQQTPIILDCQDQEPHPINEVTLFWRDYLEGEEPEEWNIEEDGYVEIYKEEDSRHILEWYCKDALGNYEDLQEEIDVVDSKAPEITKEIIGPYYGNCPPEDEEDECYIDGITQIQVTAVDPQPHPVNDVKCSWYYELLDDNGEEGGEEEVDSPFTIQFPEESRHGLLIECWDALGNSVRDYEVFIVDKTPPSTIKFYEGPVYPEEYSECIDYCREEYGEDYQYVEDCIYYECNQYYPLWIDGKTWVYLYAQDLEPHPSGVANTFYRVTLVDDEYCRDEDLDCEDAQGSGEFVTYEDAFKIEEESCHLIEYYSKDNVAKTEELKKQCVFVDKSPPVTSKEYLGPLYTGNRIIQGVNFLLEFITSQTQIIFEAEDPEPHPSGVAGTWWGVLVPEEECGENANWWLEYWWYEYQEENGEDNGAVCLPEAYVDGRIYEPLNDEFWNCVMDDDEPREDWQEACNITWWYPKWEGEYMWEYCGEDIRYKHGLWFCPYYREPVFIDQDCDHKICYFSEDNVEKQEDFRCQIVSVDNEPPEILIHNPGNNGEDVTENILRCDQSIVVEIWDNKAGVNESSVYAYLYKIENIIPVRTIKLTKAVYSGENGAIYEGLMDKQLPPGEYYLRIEAKDNLGNLGEQGLYETLEEGIYVEYLDPASCLINVGEDKNCTFTFHVCARGINWIDMCMYKLGENPRLITPDMLNAQISNNGDSTYVGLCDISDSGDLQLSEEKVNGKDTFDLSLEFSSNVTSILGTGNYDLDYTINAWDP